MNNSNNEIVMWGLIDNKKVIKNGLGNPPIDYNIHDTLLVIPGQFIRIYPHKISVKSKRELMQAAIFSIENKLAEPLERLHFSVSEDRIAIINKDYLRRCLAEVKNVGFSPKKAAADFDLLSDTTDSFLMCNRVINPGKLGNSVDMGWSEEKKTLNDVKIFKFIDRAIEKNNFLNILQNEFVQKTSLGLPFKELAFIGVLITCFIFIFTFSLAIETRALKSRL